MHIIHQTLHMNMLKLYILSHGKILMQKLIIQKVNHRVYKREKAEKQTSLTHFTVGVHDQKEQ